MLFLFSGEHRLNQKQLRDNSDPFQLPDKTFLKLFRLNKHCCQLLINGLIGHLNQPIRATKIPLHLRILIVLNFFGQGSYQLSVGHGYNFSVSQSVVSRCIAEVSDAITTFLLPDWVKFPANNNEREEIKRGFQELDNRFSDAVGVIDGTYIRIIAPTTDHPIHPGPPYYCRKNYYAINTQIISDSKKRILCINARFPGSVHDSAVWMMSGIKRIMHRYFIQTGALDFLIGDSGYPLEPWLLVPFPDPMENTPEARFNTSLSTIRILIEHVNGILKSRFRCLHGHRALNYDPIRAAKIIYSCAVLHNMCIHFRVPYPEDVNILPPPPPRLQAVLQPVVQNDLHNEAVRRRNHFVNRYFRD